MIPIGYMLKNVASPAPKWMKAPGVAVVHSLSNCVSSNFADYIPLWKHNGWWLFDTPKVVTDAAAILGVVTDALSLFYYEAHDHQYDDATGCWLPISPESSISTDVAPPDSATLSGFDVVTFSVGNSPECSPLSCNDLAAELHVNKLCLFDSFEEAYAALERGLFNNSEPGPYRIVAVYQVDQGQEQGSRDYERIERPAPGFRRQGVATTLDKGTAQDCLHSRTHSRQRNKVPGP